MSRVGQIFSNIFSGPRLHGDLTNCLILCYTYAMPDVTLKTEDLVSFTDAARILEVTRMTIYNMIAKGNLHPFHIGRNSYLFRKEVERVKSERDHQEDEPKMGRG